MAYSQENISSRYDIDSESDLYSLLPNPDKLDENDPDFMLNNVISHYYLAPNLNSLIEQNENNVLSLFHCNVRSLPKNLNLLNELLCTLIRTPDILAVTETKLHENSTVNIEVPGYNFFHTDAKSPPKIESRFIERSA